MEKRAGYAILLCGLFVILFAVSSMWSVFTGSSAAPKLITLDRLSVVVPVGGLTDLNLPPAATTAANMSMHFLLCVFLLMAGSRISAVGVSLIKASPKAEKKPDKQA